MKMDNEQKPQSDFFSSLMFGQPRKTETINEHADNQIDDAKPIENEQTEKAEDPAPSAEPNPQLESIIALAMALGPYLSKLTPLIDNVQSYFKEKNKDTSKNKKD